MTRSFCNKMASEPAIRALGSSIQRYIWSFQGLRAGVAAQAAPKPRRCRVHEWICCITDQSSMDGCPDSVPRTGCQLHFDTVASAPRSMAHNSLSHKITWWSHSIQNGQWSWLQPPNGNPGWHRAGKDPNAKRQTAEKVAERCVARKVGQRRQPCNWHRSAGAIAVRSIRRLPKEAQIDNELMSDMKGIPWQPGDGVRHKVTREVSQPAIIPAPAAAGNAASAEGINESHPTLAEDGEKVDEEGAAVVAAAQLEELIGPMEEEGEHFSAGATAEDDMVDSLTPPPSPPSAAAVSSGQPPPFRGAGWTSSLQSLPNEPTSPSGWRREAWAGTIRPTHARWSRTQAVPTSRDHGTSDQPRNLGKDPRSGKRRGGKQSYCNPTDFQCDGLCGSTSWPTRGRKNTKLWARGAFTPVHKTEIPTGSQVFSHKWVDKCSQRDAQVEIHMCRCESPI